MMQDFYLKAQALHEEFQKRELHYLNTERKMNSNMVRKKDLNLPLQEYLLKINQREKETEETYRNIMKQMEELDRHTNVMSLKLEKLGILRTSISNVAPNLIQRPDPNIGSSLQTYNAHNLYTKPNVLPLSLKSVSTQTENSLHCEKCSFPLLNNDQSNHVFENLPSSSSMNFGINDKTETVLSSKSQYSTNSLLLNETPVSQYEESRSQEYLSDSRLMPTEHKNSTDQNAKIEQVNEKFPEHEFSYNTELGESKNNSSNNQLQQSKGLVAENLQNQDSRNIEKLTISESTMNEKYDESQIPDAESSMVTFVSKSDAESMNNEFDFLETDTANRHSKVESQKISSSIKSSADVPSGVIEKVYSSAEHSSEPKFSSKTKEQNKTALHPNSKFIASDKSETSGSVSGFHSPNISVASDSDSIYEKGSPLKASAAYQALLGNVVVPRKTRKNVSDSESEDEVENALASAVQRSHIKSKTSAPSRNNETSLQLDDVKPANKSTKLVLGSKPQTKLSKSTRKVLGLDTSSGSEVEMAVKPPPGKKIDEDSDEFDFYD